MKTIKQTKLFKWLLPLMLVLMLPQIARAYNYEINGIYYNKNSDGESVTVSGYSYLVGPLEIPSTIKYNGKTYTVTAIGPSAFKDCVALTSVTIPNSVRDIGTHAFYGCTGLTSVTIPSSVWSIGVNPFSKCYGLESIFVENGNTWYDSRGNCNAIIETATNTLVSGCMSTIIPSTITSIGEETFAYCTGLTSVTIPNSVISIGNNAFTYCSGLTSVNIPNSVNSIGENAFAYCANLTLVSVPNSVTSIGRDAFIGTAWYDAQPNGLIYAGMVAYKYKGTMSPNTSIVLVDGCTGIADDAFNGCYYMNSIYIPNSVISIGQRALNGCRGLSSVVIGNSVKSIGSWAFYECSSLTSVTIPNSVTSIGVSTFYGCTSLTSINLVGRGEWNYSSSSHSGLSSIVEQIKTVNIGSEITYLGNFNFTPDVVNCYAENPPVCCDGTFANYDGVLHVPTTSIASYFIADYWQNFYNLQNDLTDKITLDKTNANLIQGETLALMATVNPDGSEILWSTSNPSVATVNENGIVTAINEGECDIYATFASNPAIYAWCHITVSYPEITISLSEDSIVLNLGDEYELVATITPENTGLVPTWQSSDESVATVENGVVTVVGDGECDITATILDKTATCHVTVINNLIISLNVDKAIIGASQMLTVYPTCTPNILVDLVVTSSDPSVAVARVVDRSKAPALASEKAIMIVGAQSGTATITVTNAEGQAEPAVLNLRVVDVDGDRTITASDITCLYNYLLSGDETHIATSDTDGDGFITSSDITVIYNLLLGN